MHWVITNQEEELASDGIAYNTRNMNIAEPFERGGAGDCPSRLQVNRTLSKFNCACTCNSRSRVIIYTYSYTYVTY